jgi:DNA-binding transcriptional regulator YdaS (Cro superfamily)
MIRVMQLLRSYLKSLDPGSQAVFCARCGTSLRYLKKVMYGRKRLGDGLAVAIERESGGAVTCESLRPDLPWAHFRLAASVSAVRVCALLRPDIDWEYLRGTASSRPPRSLSADASASTSAAS